MQKDLQGSGSFQQINKHIQDAGYKTVFLVAGKHFFSTYNNTIPQARHFIKSGANVSDQEIEKAFAAYKENREEVLIAVGGGSVIDLAKSMIYRCIESSLPVPFFIAVPTTAGSGSEATHFAVVYKNGKKVSLVHPALLPAMVILDPLLTYSLTPFQTAASGMDMLCQAVESWWNVHAIPETKEYAREAIKIWQQYFVQAVTDPQPLAREQMLYAAHLAGKAINITRTTGPHALSYYLTAKHGIEHGQAVAIFLPVFFIYNRPQKELCTVLQVNHEAEAMNMIHSKMKQAGLAISFEELGLDKKMIMDDLLDSVNEERFANNPRSFNREELQKVLTEYL